MPKVLNFKVIIEQDEAGWFVASVPAIPGAHTQGKTYEEVLKNIKEVIGLCLEEANDNINYRDQITWPEPDDKSKFLGIVDMPVRVAIA